MKHQTKDEKKDEKNNITILQQCFQDMKKQLQALQTIIHDDLNHLWFKSPKGNDYHINHLWWYITQKGDNCKNYYNFLQLYLQSDIQAFIDDDDCAPYYMDSTGGKL